MFNFTNHMTGTFGLTKNQAIMTTTITHSNIASQHTDLQLLHRAANNLKPELCRRFPELKDIVIAISYNPILAAMHETDYVAKTILSIKRQELKIVITLITTPASDIITKAVMAQLAAPAKQNVITE